MPAWQHLLDDFQRQPEPNKSNWLQTQLQTSLDTISGLRSDSNVLVYGSSFLQKPEVPAQYIQITHEDLNGFMSVLYAMNWSRPLSLILHTPGGVTNATESLVDYLRSKFDRIEVIVPTYSMSAGTMIALASDLIIMGRQSQLGPIDPQMPYSGRFVSARAIVDQFQRAKQEVQKDLVNAHVWAPILSSLGPSLVQEAQNALDYGEEMVGKWLSQFMFAHISDDKQRRKKAESVAEHFNDATKHKSHGRRIDRNEVRNLDIRIEDLESNQELQDSVLTAYHLMTIMFEQSTATKILWSHHGQQWIKNWVPVPS